MPLFCLGWCLRGGSVPPQSAPRVVTEQHTAGMLENEARGRSTLELCGAQTGQKRSAFMLSALGCSRLRIQGKFMLCGLKMMSFALGARPCDRGAGNGTQAGSQIGLVLSRRPRSSADGQARSGGVFRPPRLSFLRPLRTLSTRWWQRSMADRSRRAHLGCTRFLSRLDVWVAKTVL